MAEVLEDRALLAGVAELEPNNVPAEAGVLALTQEPAGSGLFASYATGMISPATGGGNFSDPDYWKFQAFAGDRISVAAATPESDLDAYVELRNSAGGVLASDEGSGAGSDAFISDVLVPSSGTYYVLVRKNRSSTVSAAYQLRVDLARGIDLESDANHANDSLAGADPLTLTQQGGSRAATVTGTIMAGEGGHPDVDYFSLGSPQGGENHGYDPAPAGNGAAKARRADRPASGADSRTGS